MSPSFRLHEDIVILSVEILFPLDRRFVVRLPSVSPSLGRSSLTILGMEVSDLLKRGGKSDPVDVEIIVVDFSWPLVDQGDQSGFIERHRKVTIHRVTRGNIGKSRLVAKEFPESQTEKVSEWDFHAWLLLAIPVGAKDDLLEIQRRVRGGIHSNPHVTNLARPFQICDFYHISRFRLWDEVVVSTSPVPTSRSTSFIIAK